MVKHTPQREWIEERGLLIWLSTFFVEVGASSFLVGALLDHVAAMAIGIVMCATLGAGLHLADLGRPLRFWRILLSTHWKTSWIARGMWFVSLFIGLGALYTGLALLSVPVPLLLPPAVFFALCTVLYFGFLLSYIRGLALWNSSLLPVLILVISIWGGLNVLTLTSLIGGSLSPAADRLSLLYPLCVLLTAALYLFTIRYQGIGGKVSFGEITAGKWSPLFWIGFVFCGLVFPLFVGLLDKFAFPLPPVFPFISALLQLGANLSLRYCILRCAFYEPVIPASSYGPQMNRG